MRAIGTRIEQVTTHGRHGGEVAAAVKIILAEVAQSPLTWLAQQQARDRRDGRG